MAKSWTLTNLAGFIKAEEGGSASEPIYIPKAGLSIKVASSVVSLRWPASYHGGSNHWEAIYTDIVSPSVASNEALADKIAFWSASSGDDRTSAFLGVDTISGTVAVTPPAGVDGWKYYVAMSDTVINAFTDNGDTSSVISSGVTITAGNFVSANGLFTSITLTSGDGVAYRG